MDADREIEDAFRDAEEFHPQRNVEDDPLSSPSDDAIALRFSERHASDLRFVANWGQWLRHNGRQWRHDDTLHARDLARDVCRASAEEFDYKTAIKIASAKTISAVESLARSDRRLAATVDQWDADPWLLNTPDGVVDLKTGILRPHRIEDYMTKITAIGPGGNCPLFLAFLDRIMSGDHEVISYIQRVFGYGLTGEIIEHALFFWYGTGANGKSVLLSTVSGLLGDYHTAAPIETFTVSNSDRHPTDLAGLRGARLVSASETEEGRRWAEAKIKQLTGGDRIAARFMRQDFFTYQPAFKLIIAGNHKPSLRSVDEAIRRRFHLVPFAVTIPEHERDLELTKKLKAEWPGILAWIIQGCVEWQKTGLRPPAAVREATDAYLESEDAIAAWLEERCERDPNAWESSTTIFASWSAWAAAAGEYVGSQKQLTQKLEKRGGFVGKRTNKSQGMSGMSGLRILPEETPRSSYYDRDM
jgi:putative DNA primase/helicase